MDGDIASDTVNSAMCGYICRHRDKYKDSCTAWFVSLNHNHHLAGLHPPDKRSKWKDHGPSTDARNSCSSDFEHVMDKSYTWRTVSHHWERIRFHIKHTHTTYSDNSHTHTSESTQGSARLSTDRRSVIERKKCGCWPMWKESVWKASVCEWLLLFSAE